VGIRAHNRTIKNTDLVVGCTSEADGIRISKGGLAPSLPVTLKTYRAAQIKPDDDRTDRSEASAKRMVLSPP
jgi:hypothetical protein